MLTQQLQVRPTDSGTRQTITYLWFNRAETIPEKYQDNKNLRDYPWLPEGLVFLSSLERLSKDGSKSQLDWENTEDLTLEWWGNLEAVFISVFRRLIELSRQKPSVEPEQTKFKNGPIPGLMIAELATEDLEDAQAIAGILYQVAPNEVTAIAAVTTTGLVVLDDLSGESGMKAIGFLPVMPQVILVPNEPKVFIENLIKLQLSPSEQVKFLSKHGASIAGLGKSIGLTVPMDMANRALTKALDKLGAEEAAKIVGVSLDAYKALIGGASDLAGGLASELGEEVKIIVSKGGDVVKDAVKDVGNAAKKLGKKLGW